LGRPQGRIGPSEGGSIGPDNDHDLITELECTKSRLVHFEQEKNVLRLESSILEMTRHARRDLPETDWTGSSTSPEASNPPAGSLDPVAKMLFGRGA